jgi:hypothetical protein
MRMTNLVPMLQTEDMAGTRNWYEEVLGFRCVSDPSEGWCRLERDDIDNVHEKRPFGVSSRDSYAIHLRRRRPRTVELHKGAVHGRVGTRKDALWSNRVRCEESERLSIEFRTARGITGPARDRYWHFLAIRFGGAPRAERPVRVGPFLTHLGPFRFVGPGRRCRSCSHSGRHGRHLHQRRMARSVANSSGDRRPMCTSR